MTLPAIDITPISEAQVGLSLAEVQQLENLTAKVFQTYCGNSFSKPIMQLTEKFFGK
jgi:hypothetical protein